MALVLESAAPVSLSAAVSPADAANPSLAWQSSDETVATVDQSGLVTARGAGRATVSAYARRGGESASCEVNVTSELLELQEALSKIVIGYAAGDGPSSITGNLSLPASGPSGISVSPASRALVQGSSTRIVATVSPSTARDKSVFFASSDPAVATVDPAGLVRAFKPGNDAITARANDGLYETTCSLSVSSGYADVLAAAAVRADLSLPAAGLKGTTVGWASSDPSIVQAGGRVARPDDGERHEVVFSATVRKGSSSTTKGWKMHVLGQRYVDPALYAFRIELNDAMPTGDIEYYEWYVDGVKVENNNTQVLFFSRSLYASREYAVQLRIRGRIDLAHPVERTATGNCVKVRVEAIAPWPRGRGAADSHNCC